MTTWITPDDVANRWIGGDLPDADIIAELIADTEVVVRDEFPDIDIRIAASPGLLDKVRFVARQMVIRVLQNPDGVRSRTSQTGPYSDTTTMGGDDPGSPWLTEKERAMLSGQRAPRAFSIDMTAGQTPSRGLGGGSRW